MRLVVVTFGAGNVGSIPNMLKRVGVAGEVTDDPDVVERADKLILPGVGAFDPAITNLRARGLDEALNRQVLERGTPILGLCLGMQLLAERSEEGAEAGLGWIPGVVRRLDPGNESLRVPQMGWNTARAVRDHPLVRHWADDARFYFAHSYVMTCRDDSDPLALTDYGVEFASIVQRGNVMGTQFHPEKSHRHGMQLLRNYVEMP